MANIEDFDSTLFEPNYEERTYPIRGKVIAHFAMFEKNFETVLAAEFSGHGEVRTKMQNIIFDRMTFENKRTALKTILLKRANENGFERSKKKGHPNKMLIEELTYLNSIRNQFAHYPTIQATNQFEYSCAIGLIEYRDSPNFKWFTSEKLIQLLKGFKRRKVRF